MSTSNNTQRATLLIDSRDRAPTDDPSDYSIWLPRPLYAVSGARLVSAEVPNLGRITGLVDLVVDGKPYAIEVPVNTYSRQGVVDALQAALGPTDVMAASATWRTAQPFISSVAPSVHLDAFQAIAPMVAWGPAVAVAAAPTPVLVPRTRATLPYIDTTGGGGFDLGRTTWTPTTSDGFSVTALVRFPSMATTTGQDIINFGGGALRVRRINTTDCELVVSGTAVAAAPASLGAATGDWQLVGARLQKIQMFPSAAYPATPALLLSAHAFQMTDTGAAVTAWSSVTSRVVAGKTPIVGRPTESALPFVDMNAAYLQGAATATWNVKTLGGFTAVCYVNLPAGNAQHVFDFSAALNQNGLFMRRVGTSNDLAFGASTAGGVVGQVVAAAALVPGTWQLLVGRLVYNAGANNWTFRLDVDGATSVAVAVTVALEDRTATQFIGSLFGTTTTAMQVREMAFYNRALSDAEILTLAQNRLGAGAPTEAWRASMFVNEARYQGVGAAGSIAFQNAAPATVGASAVHLRDVLLFGVALTDAQFDSAQRYLSTKYVVPVTIPRYALHASDASTPVRSTAFPAMTSAITPAGYVVTTSNQYWGPAWRALDGSTGFDRTQIWGAGSAAPNVYAYNVNPTLDGIYSGTTTTTVVNVGVVRGEWMQIQLPTATYLGAYRLTGGNFQSGSTRVHPRVPDWIAVLGSNNGTTWTLVDRRSDAMRYNGLEIATFRCASPGTYSYYRLVVERLQAGWAYYDNVLELNQWSLHDTSYLWGTGVAAVAVGDVSDTQLPIVVAGAGLTPPHVNLNARYYDLGTTTWNVATNGGFTLLAAVKFNGSVVANERVFDFGNGVVTNAGVSVDGNIGAGSNNITLYREAATAGLRFQVYEGTTATVNILQSNAIVQNEWMLLGVQLQRVGAQWLPSIWVNGVKYPGAPTTATLSNRTVFDSFLGYSVARSGGGGVGVASSLHVRDCVMYDRGLGDAEIGSMTAYLAARWSLMYAVPQTYDTAVTDAARPVANVALDPATARLAIRLTNPAQTLTIPDSGRATALGFPGGVAGAVGGATGSRAISLVPERDVYLSSPELGDIARIPLNVTPQFVAFFCAGGVGDECANFDFRPVRPPIARLQKIRLQFKTRDGAPADFKGLDHGLTLELTCARGSNEIQ